MNRRIMSLRNDRFVRAILAVAMLVFGCASTQASELFTTPRRTAPDEIVLLSTRAIGTKCRADAMERGLKCYRYEVSATGKSHWRATDWHDLLDRSPAVRPTIVYVHGNRVTAGQDRSEGMRVYRSLKRSGCSEGPVRLIIWSWPSAPVRGLLKDYKIKANRTDPVAWQLAWFLDQLPSETRLSLIGFSYGSRVVSGATHLLTGGHLGALAITNLRHPQRPPMRVALLAAAFDADWIEPGHYFGRSISRIERLVVTINPHDPAMRFYHLINGRRGVHALGKQGIRSSATMGTAARRVRQLNFASDVGRSHALTDYLAANNKMKTVWRELQAGQRLQTSGSRTTTALTTTH